MKILKSRAKLYNSYSDTMPIVFDTTVELLALDWEIENFKWALWYSHLTHCNSLSDGRNK